MLNGSDILDNVSVIRLLRVLCYNNPVFPEEIVVNNGFIESRLTEDICAFEHPDGSFIIFDGDLKFTSNELPKEKVIRNIFKLPADVKETPLRDLVTHKVNSMVANNLPMFFDFNEALQAIPECGAIKGIRDDGLTDRVINFISTHLLTARPYADIEIENWADSCLQLLLKNVLNFSMCVEDVLPLWIPIFIIHLSPEPAASYAASILHLRVGAGPDINSTRRFLIPIDLDFYLNRWPVSPKLRRIIFKHLPLMLEARGDNTRKLAQNSGSLEVFFKRLYEAGFYYQGAKLVARHLLRADWENETLRRIYRHCEEMYVTIFTSLNRANQLHIKDIPFSDPKKFGAYIDRLIQMNREEAENLIIENANELLMPNYLKNYFLGWVWCYDDEMWLDGIEVIENFLEHCEKNLKLHIGSNEISYFSACHRLLANTYERFSKTEKSNEYKGMINSNNLQKLVDKQFPA